MSDSTPQARQVRGAAADIVAPAPGMQGAEIRGTVRIAPGVLIRMIEVTVEGMDGVAGLRSHHRRRWPEAPASNGKSYDNGKVVVRINGDQIVADIALAVHRGVNVTELSAAVQQRIGAMVGRMLGMTVQSVNIYIEEIAPPPDVR
jgi:uncharacterized alkaline shock family protein YloU